MNPKYPSLMLATVAALLGLAAASPAQNGQKPKNPPASKPAPKGKDNPKDNPKDKPKDAAAPKKPDAKEALVEVDGEWYTKEEKDKLDKGWKRLDLDWIPPDEAGNIKEGKFKINKNWVSEAEANEYHYKEEQPWEIPTKHFIVAAPIARAQAVELAKHAESTWDLMARVLGGEPKLEPRKKFKIRIFGNVDAGNEFAAQAQGEVAHHTTVFAGYVADWEPDKPAVALFDGEKGTDKYGFSRFHVAHAVAHKFMEESIPEIDKAPQWFIEGLASYADRYSIPQYRDWAIQQLVRRGGVPKLNNFAKKFALTADDPDASQTKLHEAALIVAYYATTTDKTDEANFKKAIASLKKPTGRDAAIDTLLEKPDDLDKKLKKFAGI
jgi:hypothetical protein